VEVGLDELNIHVGVEVVRGDDVEHRGVRHLVGVIERHPVRHPAAAILSDDGKLVEAEVLHDFYLIECHRALRVVDVHLAVGWFAAVAVATKVGDDDRASRGELRCTIRQLMCVCGAP
jgi:hypothetical protein